MSYGQLTLLSSLWVLSFKNMARLLNVLTLSIFESDEEENVSSEISPNLTFPPKLMFVRFVELLVLLEALPVLLIL